MTEEQAQQIEGRLRGIWGRLGDLLDPSLEGVEPTPHNMTEVIGDFSMWLSDVTGVPHEDIADFRRFLAKKISENG